MSNLGRQISRQTRRRQQSLHRACRRPSIAIHPGVYKAMGVSSPDRGHGVAVPACIHATHQVFPPRAAQVYFSLTLNPAATPPYNPADNTDGHFASVDSFLFQFNAVLSPEISLSISRSLRQYRSSFKRDYPRHAAGLSAQPHRWHSPQLLHCRERHYRPSPATLRG